MRFERLRQEAKERFDPGPFHPRYYVLRSLRERLELLVGTHLDWGVATTVVDFGGGSMPYRPIFNRTATQYIGVDVDANPLAEAHVSADSRTTLQDNTADIVLSTQVLEHVAEPRQYLLECRRILKPGGLLILSTHGHWMYHPDPEDYWRWTKPGLMKLLSEAGFLVLDVQGVLGLAATGIQFLQDGLMPRVPGLLRPPFAALMQTFARICDRIEPAVHRETNSCVYLTAARKEQAT